MYTIDFEAKRIINGSPMAPMPVGVSIKHNGNPSKYYAWAHPKGNNSTYVEVLDLLTEIWASDEQVLCHNAKFDIRIINEYFGLPMLEPSRIDDTMIMAYLIDAREVSLELKVLTHKYCGMPPDEQKDLHDWIIKHIPGSKSEPGAYISEAPVHIVGKYAESDTDRTYALYHTLHNQIFDAPVVDGKQNILDAYSRERKVIPITIALEQTGVTISPDIHKVRKELEHQFELLDLQLSAYSGGQKPGSKAMFDTFRKKGFIDESKIQYTDKGNPRYGKEFIEDLISDKHLSGIIKLRSKLQKLLGTYVRPFSESAKLYNGKFYPYYNQTRSENDLGTRTGRFSSNIQQLPKDGASNTDNYIDGNKLDDLPSVRTLIQASTGNVLIKRDFSGQELRVTAHYAEGKILDAYKADPRLDVHAFVDKLIIEMTGHHLSRTPVKMISFLKLYGGGPKQLAKRLNIPLEQAYTFFNAYDTALPEFKGLMKDIEKVARSGTKIRTWGGRSYAVEEAKDGRDFYYKLGNVLIQGSSADMTKEAMIRYHYHPDRKGKLLMTVHDELVCEVAEQYAEQEMVLLRWAMDEIPGWDCPLRSDGKIGFNLAKMAVYEDE